MNSERDRSQDSQSDTITNYIYHIMVLSTIFVVAQFALAASVAYVIYQCYFHPLACYPGPLLARFTNLWRLFTFFGGQLHLTEQHLHDKYGHVVRVAPNWLSFSDLQDFDAIYGFNKSVEKDDFYVFGRPHDNRVRSIFALKADAEHRQRRRKVVGPALTSAKIARYESVITKHVDLFFTRAEAESSSRQGGTMTTVNLAPLAHRFTTDVTVELIYGPGTVSHPYTDSAAGAMMCSVMRMLSKMAWSFSLCPSYGWIMNSRLVGTVLRKLTVNKQGGPTGMMALRALSYPMIFQRPGQISLPVQPGLVKSWLEVPLDDASRMTPDEVYSEALNMVFAGPGSVAAALTAMVYQLGTREGQVWQEKLRKEADIGVLPFSLELQAVVKETLRHCASFPTAFPRVIRPGAQTV
ncbi:cytochrome P450, partial [Aspergillus bertholletiae]